MEGLVGKCFVIFGKDRCFSKQGHVKAYLGEGYFLVQFFEALMGDPSTLAVFHIEQMGYRDREPGSWELFEDDAHLREWVETFGFRRIREVQKERELEQVRKNQ